MAEKQETPLMRQYWEIKSAHLDKILLFRMGDFFEMFFDDAVIAAPLLGIALTSRNKKSGDDTPMCGLPHHAVGGPINRLLSAGYKVAICDQIEDPKQAKGIVKRAVTRVLTPGMVYDSNTLESTSSHYLAALEIQNQDERNFQKIRMILALADVTTGDAFYFENLNINDVNRVLAFMPVAELVLESETAKEAIFNLGMSWTKTLSFFEAKSKEQSQGPFGNSACHRLTQYIGALGGLEALETLRSFELRQIRHRMEVGSETLRHLEIFENYKGQSQGSLFKAIDRTQSSPGARQLKQWLYFPLRQTDEIEKRLSRISVWFESPGELKNIRSILSTVGDIERRLSRLSTPQANGRDLISVGQATLSAIKAFAVASQKEAIHFDSSQLFLGDIQNLVSKTFKSIREDAPISIRQGYLINEGVSSELDEYINLSQNAQGMISEMEARERAATGISSLKIRYNNVFGYYIEITNTHKEKVPSTYQRKQTLANAERYCTDELIELEKKVLVAQTKRSELEFTIFEEVRKEWLKYSNQVLILANKIAVLDVVTSFAWLAIERKYTRPLFNNEGRLTIKGSRHPGVEQEVEKHFIANDIHLEKGGMMLITGPNMAGKSTLMRQVALTALMAQIGCFVPAAAADLPVFDCIFTRIGASDQLSEGLSTFMVEMKETATLLKESTAQSLVIVDEVGRGTSTADGLSLAQAILEHLVTQVGCMSLFATHYHELTQLEGQITGVLNYHMAVSESGKDVQFLHTLVRGPTLKSYGVYVAELAGLPPAVTKRARSLLKNHQQGQSQVSNQLALDFYSSESEAQSGKEGFEMDLNTQELLSEIKGLSVSAMTPLDALNKLAQLQSRIQ